MTATVFTIEQGMAQQGYCGLWCVQSLIKPAELEAAGQQQQIEAWYKELSADINGQQQSNGYRRLYLQWLQQPMTTHAAYLQRAIMNTRAKCYLQVHMPLLLLSCLHAVSFADYCITEMDQCM